MFINGRIPDVGLGTAPLGGLYTEVPVEEAAATVRAAVDIGYRYFDTAPLYGYGSAERVLGLGLADCHADVIISTKVGRIIDESAPRPVSDMFSGAWGTARWDFSSDGVLQSLDSSLQRLGRDSVDLVLIHDPDDFARQALDEAYPALERLRDEGVVSGIGIGMNEPSLPARFVTDTDIDVVLIAGRYTLLDQSAAQVLFPVAEAREVHLIAAGLYNSGILTGTETVPHFDYAATTTEIVARVRKLHAICEDFAVPLGAAAVQFAVQRQAVGTVLMGARSPVEAAQNWSHAHMNLPDELWSALNERLIDEGHVD